MGVKMLGISFFSNRVASQMFKKGFPPKELPKNEFFIPLCNALKANGYSAEGAANLWIRMLSNNNSDKEAIRELYENTGSVAVILLGPIEKFTP